MLNEHGLKQLFSIHTRDVYYAKEDNFDGMSENEMNCACIRIRYCQKLNSEEADFSENEKNEKGLDNQGLFDFHKTKFNNLP